jgi:amino acid transporter
VKMFVNGVRTFIDVLPKKRFNTKKMEVNHMTNNIENDGKLGVLACTMILIGGMVGSAVFSLSGVTYAIAGPASIISWVVAGIILMTFGLMAAELGGIYPESGGAFVFPYEALGKTKKSKEAWGWATAWLYLNVNFFGAAFSAIYIANYLGTAFPFFAPYQTQLAIIWVIACGLLTMMNISIAGRVNLVLVLLLIALILVYCFAGFGAFNSEYLTPFFSQGSGGTFGFIGAIPIAMLAYGAVVSIAFMVSQVRNPKKTVPRAVLSATAVAIVLYIAVIFVTSGLLKASYFNAAETAWAQYVPLYAAAWTTLYSLPWLPAVISIAAVLALTTTLLVLMMTAGWTIQSAAAKGLLPKGLAKINSKTKAPVNAMLLTLIVVIISSVIPDVTNVLINSGAISLALVVCIMSATLIAARKKNERKSGDFRLFGGSVVPVILSLAVLYFILPGIYQAWSYWRITAIWFIAGVVIFGVLQITQKNEIEDDTSKDIMG